MLLRDNNAGCIRTHLRNVGRSNRLTFLPGVRQDMLQQARAESDLSVEMPSRELLTCCRALGRSKTAGHPGHSNSFFFFGGAIRDLTIVVLPRAMGMWNYLSRHERVAHATSTDLVPRSLQM